MRGNAVQMEFFAGAGDGMAGAGPSPSTPPSAVPPPLAAEPEPAMVRVAPGRHAWVPKSATT